jgi:hypothetical protein
MNRLLAWVLVAIGLLLVGFGAGWHEKGVHVAAGETKAAKADVQAVTANFQAQGQKQAQTLAKEQDKSIALATAQQLTRATSATIQLEIRDAEFTPVPPAAGDSCADPAASPEWVQLYNAAAAGHPTTAASTSAGGVHGTGAGVVPAGPDADPSQH